MKQNTESDGYEVGFSIDNTTLMEAVNIPPQPLASVPMLNNEQIIDFPNYISL